MNNELVNQIIGAVSPETATYVNGYPYGFRLRTQIRYWVESKPKFGQRLVSQTMNPKNGRWNKPKAGTYSEIVIMGKAANGYIVTDALSVNATEEEVNAFQTKYRLDAFQSKQSDVIRAWARVNTHVTWSVTEAKDGERGQTLAEQSDILNTLARAEYAGILKERQCGAS